MAASKPEYLTAAEREWERVRHDATAEPAEIREAEDALTDARADAAADGFTDD